MSNGPGKAQAAVARSIRRKTGAEKEKEYTYITQTQDKERKEKKARERRDVKAEKTLKKVKEMTSDEREKMSRIQKDYMKKGVRMPSRSELLKKIRAEGTPS
jgi:hypothetical protein